MVLHGKTKKDFFINFGIFILGFCLLVFLFQDTKNSLNTIQKPRVEEKMRTFSSEDMLFSVEVSNFFQVIEDTNEVIFHKQDGDITIKRVPTDKENIEEFLQHFTNNNLFSLSKRETFTIDDLPAVKGFINNDLYYFIFSGERYVYVLTTSEELLFDTLNSLADSFQYAP